jgi:hypothetical protein
MEGEDPFQRSVPGGLVVIELGDEGPHRKGRRPFTPLLPERVVRTKYLASLLEE